MVKYVGGAIVLLYAAMNLWGYEPFASSERGRVPADARRGPGGVLIWHSGFLGGK
ncbi:MAG: hypothetical protein IRZ16_10525 [Myxococcaceae bacterium]|nr:hypothetical protein [Myxococcaceae bacterium]